VKYFRRFRTDGSPFYVNEGGEYVSEEVAKTNLVESSRSAATFRELSMIGESAANRNREDRNAARKKMDEAFHRRIAIACGQQVEETSRDGRDRISVSVSRQQAASAMEEALARFAPNAARA
jgi:hypothetical protein